MSQLFSQCPVILYDNKEASAVLYELGVDFAEDLELRVLEKADDA